MTATETTTPKDGRPQSGSVSVINLEKFKDTVLFAITIRRWGNSARIKDMAALEQYIELSKVKQDEGDAEKNGGAPSVFVASDRVKSNKALIRSASLDRLNKAMNALKARVEAVSIPSYFRPGMFVSKQANVLNVENMLKNGWKAIEENELAGFLGGYKEDVAAAQTVPVNKGGLGPLFNAKDYPSLDELSKVFKIEWYWMALSVPENIPDELRAEANEKFQRRMQDAAQQIEEALRSELLELVAHAEDRLTTKPGEKTKIFRDSMIANLMEFIRTFDSRDVFGDERLKQVVEQAKTVLLDEKGNARMDGQKLRDFPNVRETTRAKFAAIRETLDSMIEEKGRKLDLVD